ncbi:MAG: DUF4357 domain-containing protein [Planctomycetaceae bacterium]|nr:DUF4357 domain-containing protein [Planctomycetaceae bacterium]
MMRRTSFPVQHAHAAARRGHGTVAAAVLSGRPSNGWIDWKTADGKTLDEVKRQ